jgi:FkbM family methyltransferase
MQVLLPEPVSEDLTRFGLTEPGLTAFLLALLRPGQTFVDVGAHFGFFTLLGAHLVGPSGRVHAFEPTPATHALLSANTAALPTVTRSPYALWSEEGEIQIRDFGGRLSAYNSAFQPRLDDEPGARLVAVPAISLDEFCARHDVRPDLVKIDAESAESRILSGMARLLEEERVAVTVEVGDYDIEGVPPSAELIESVTARGYAAFEYADAGIRPHRIRERYEYDNILLVPGEHPFAAS